MDKKLLLVLLIGILTRLVLAPFFGHPYDMFVWLKAGEMSFKHSINVYAVQEIPDYPWGFYTYPPLWLYWLSFSAWLFNFVPSINFFAFVVKIPMIVSDALIAIILYRYIRLLDHSSSGIKMAALWFLNPFTVFISSVWGMFDSIAVLFALLGVIKLMEGKNALSAILIGTGAAVKIFPAILVLPALLYIKRKQGSQFIKNAISYVCYLSIVPIASSILFLGDPITYLRKIFFHFSNVGQFTYWMVFSSLIDPNILGYISITLMVVSVTIVFLRMARQERNSNDLLINGSAALLLTLLSTSVKVNVQYLTWILPFLIILLQRERGKIFGLNMLTLYISACIFLTASIGILNCYDLKYMGNMVNLEFSIINVFGSLILASGLLGSSRIIALLLYLLKIKNIDYKIISKWTVITIVLLFVVAIVTFPTPAGVKIENMHIKVGVIESPDSAFVIKEGYGVEEFLEKYDLTHVVLPFSLDFINTYNGYQPDAELSRYFKFTVSPLSWRSDDVKDLIGNIKSKNVSVLLGIYLRPQTLIVRYGIHGYKSTWLTDTHKEVLLNSSIVDFCSILKQDGRFVFEEQTYAEYLTSKIKDIVKDFGFDGVYIIGWKDEEDSVPSESIVCLLDELGPAMKSVSKGIFIGDLHYNIKPEFLSLLLSKVDYLVIRTSPSYDFIHSKNIDGVSLDDYIEKVRLLTVNLSKCYEKKLLFTIYAMDIAEGWMTPAITLQEEVGAFSRMGCFDGFVVVHSNKYLPYRITYAP